MLGKGPVCQTMKTQAVQVAGRADTMQLRGTKPPAEAAITTIASMSQKIKVLRPGFVQPHSVRHVAKTV
jgi:hypothetical protein